MLGGPLLILPNGMQTGLPKGDSLLGTIFGDASWQVRPAYEQKIKIDQ
jgi:hypothetical protein